MTRPRFQSIPLHLSVQYIPAKIIARLQPVSSLFHYTYSLFESNDSSLLRVFPFHSPNCDLFKFTLVYSLFHSCKLKAFHSPESTVNFLFHQPTATACSTRQSLRSVLPEPMLIPLTSVQHFPHLNIWSVPLTRVYSLFYTPKSTPEMSQSNPQVVCGNALQAWRSPTQALWLGLLLRPYGTYQDKCWDLIWRHKLWYVW